MLTELQDAYGQELMSFFKTGTGYEIIERDDGYVDISGGPRIYFSQYEDWADHEKTAIKHVEGRVLDIGCGAGRHSLYLQEKGHDVLGIDNSPLAVKVCWERGIKSVKTLSITQITKRLGVFDTIIMFGNNFGLLANTKRAKWLLKKFYNLTSSQGRILAESRNPYATENPKHREYHQFNVRRGRLSGQLRIRVRFEKYIGPWFDYLIVSKDEMKDILDGTRWAVSEFIDGKDEAYIAVIKKEL